MPVWEFEPGGGVGIAEFIARLHRERWEPVRKALPVSAQGPEFRARVAIELLVEAALKFSCRDVEGRERDSATAQVDGALAALTGRDRGTIAALTLVRQIESDATFELLHGRPPVRRRFYEGMWPEYPVDDAAYRDAVTAWVTYERTKRGNKWPPVIAALRSARLAETMTHTSLRRKWRAWQRDGFFGR